MVVGIVEFQALGISVHRAVWLIQQLVIVEDAVALVGEEAFQKDTRRAGLRDEPDLVQPRPHHFRHVVEIAPVSAAGAVEDVFGDDLLHVANVLDGHVGVNAPERLVGRETNADSRRRRTARRAAFQAHVAVVIHDAFIVDDGAGKRMISHAIDVEQKRRFVLGANEHAEVSTDTGGVRISVVHPVKRPAAIAGSGPFCVRRKRVVCADVELHERSRRLPGNGARVSSIRTERHRHALPCAAADAVEKRRACDAFGIAEKRADRRGRAVCGNDRRMRNGARSRAGVCDSRAVLNARRAPLIADRQQRRALAVVEIEARVDLVRAREPFCLERNAVGPPEHYGATRIERSLGFVVLVVRVARADDLQAFVRRVVGVGHDDRTTVQAVRSREPPFQRSAADGVALERSILDELNVRARGILAHAHVVEKDFAVIEKAEEELVERVVALAVVGRDEVVGHRLPRTQRRGV